MTYCACTALIDAVRVLPFGSGSSLGISSFVIAAGNARLGGACHGRIGITR
jgi:hypothetical protein